MGIGKAPQFGRVLLALVACLAVSAQTYEVQAVAGKDHATEGPGLGALIRLPKDLVAGRDGSFYVSDEQDGRIRRINRDYTVTNLAGNGVCCTSGDGGPALQARVGHPKGLAFDSLHNLLYVAQPDYGRVRVIDLNSGIISTAVGNGKLTYTPANENKPATQVSMAPQWLACDVSGNLFISDEVNARLYRVDASSRIFRTIGGSGLPEKAEDFNTDGRSALSVSLDPNWIAASPTTVVFGDGLNLRNIDLSSGIIRTSVRMYNRDPALGFAFVNGEGLTKPILDGSIIVPAYLAGSVYRFSVNALVDLSNLAFYLNWKPDYVYRMSPGNRDLIRILAINAATALTLGDREEVNRIVGDKLQPVAGMGDTPPSVEKPLETYLQSPASLAFTPTGELLVADFANGKLRVIDATRSQMTIPRGFPQGAYPSPFALNPAVVAVTISKAGQIIYLAGNRLYLLSPDRTSYDRLAGLDEGFGGDGGPPNKAQFSLPLGVAVASDGSILIADYGNQRIRRISPDGRTISTVVGNGTAAFVSGAAPLATGIVPSDLQAGPDGLVYISDATNNRIYRYDPIRQTIESIAGTGTAGFSGDGGLATNARLDGPTSVAVSRQGEVFIADRQNGRIRRISPNGVIRTIAGNGNVASNGDGGPALNASMIPYRLAIGPDNAIYFSDFDFHFIRRLVQIAPGDALSLVQGNGQASPINAALPETLRVQLHTASGEPVANAPIQYTTLPGKILILEADTQTGADGTASARVMLLQTGETVLRVTASTADNAVEFHLTALPAPGPIPATDITSIFGAGLTLNTLSPLGLAAVFGDGFAPEGTNRNSALEDSTSDGHLPTRSAGVCIEINSVRAPLLWVSASRIDFQTPLVPPSPATLFQIIRDCDGPGETRSAPITVAVTKTSAEFQTWTPGAAPQPVRAVDAATGALIGPASLGTDYQPARAGQTLNLFATGLGLADGPDVVGGPAASDAIVFAAVRVRLGGRILPATAKLVASMIGVYAVQIVVPGDLGGGDWDVLLVVDSVDSPKGPVLTVGQL